jgi:hypothetical protein
LALDARLSRDADTVAYIKMILDMDQQTNAWFITFAWSQNARRKPFQAREKHLDGGAAPQVY